MNTQRVVRALGTASTLATIFALRFHWDDDDRLSKVSFLTFPVYSRARGEKRARLKAEREAAAQKPKHELPDFGGRE